MTESLLQSLGIEDTCNLGLATLAGMLTIYFERTCYPTLAMICGLLSRTPCQRCSLVKPRHKTLISLPLPLHYMMMLSIYAALECAPKPRPKQQEMECDAIVSARLPSTYNAPRNGLGPLPQRQNLMPFIIYNSAGKKGTTSKYKDVRPTGKPKMNVH